MLKLADRLLSAFWRPVAAILRLLMGWSALRMANTSLLISLPLVIYGIYSPTRVGLSILMVVIFTYLAPMNILDYIELQKPQPIHLNHQQQQGYVFNRISLSVIGVFGLIFPSLSFGLFLPSGLIMLGASMYFATSRAKGSAFWATEDSSGSA